MEYYKNNNLDGLIFKDFNCNKVNSYLEFDQCLDTITFNGKERKLEEHYINPYFHFKIGKKDNDENEHNTNLVTTFGKQYKITDYSQAKRCIPNSHIDHESKTVTTKVIWFSGQQLPSLYDDWFRNSKWCISEDFIEEADMSKQISPFGPIEYLWLGVIIIPLLTLARMTFTGTIINYKRDPSYESSIWATYFTVYQEECKDVRELRIKYTLLSILAKGLFSYWFHRTIISYRDYCVFEDDYLRCGLNTKISKSVMILVNLTSFHDANSFITIFFIISFIHCFYILPLTIFFLIAFFKVKFSIFIKLFNFSFFPLFNIFTEDLYQNINTPLGAFYSPNLWILFQEIFISIFVLIEFSYLYLNYRNTCDKDNTNHQNKNIEKREVEISSTQI